MEFAFRDHRSESEKMEISWLCQTVKVVEEHDGERHYRNAEEPREKTSGGTGN